MKSKTFQEALRKAKKQLQPSRPHEHKEDDLQEVCVGWFKLAYSKYKLLLYHVPNGGKRDAREAARFKALGVVAGVSDLNLDIAAKGFHGLRIEMKAGKNKQSEHQKEWQKEIERQGFKYVVCYSFDEFQDLINWYLND